MKGITTHVMVILFSVIIMVVLLVVGIGLVQNYTNIPFEKLWELTPQSSIAQEPGYGGDGGHSYTVEDFQLPHIFTAPGAPYDLSEIACLIGNDISKDFIDYGTSPTRPTDAVKTQPFDGGNGYLVGKGFFLYEQGTDTSQFDSAFDKPEFNDKYEYCHICRTWPETPGVGLGIIHLDETCVNMQLRDIKVGSNYLCHGTTGASYLPGDNLYSDGNVQTAVGLATFGNANDGGIPGDNNVGNWNELADGCIIDLNPFGCSGGFFGVPGNPWHYENDDNDFCDNNQDMIASTVNKADVSWTGKWKVKDSSTGHTGSGDVLSDLWNYTYGVYWVPGKTRYDIVFALIPQANSYTTPTNDFSPIWNEILDSGKDFNRVSALGFEFWGARTVADFNVVPIADTSILYIRTEIAKKVYGSAPIENINKIVCDDCSDLEDCLTRPYGGQATVGITKYCFRPQTGDDTATTNFEKQNILLRVNATDGGGNKITCDNIPDILIAGHRYRVIIKNWFNIYSGGCYDHFDRSVTILDLGLP